MCECTYVSHNIAVCMQRLNPLETRIRIPGYYTFSPFSLHQYLPRVGALLSEFVIRCENILWQASASRSAVLYWPLLALHYCSLTLHWLSEQKGLPGSPPPLTSQPASQPSDIEYNINKMQTECTWGMGQCFQLIFAIDKMFV